MNKIALNTVPLDGGDVIIKKGSGGGGGVTINNQSKSVDITENGTTEVTADTGYTGLGKVTINTNVASSGGGSDTESGKECNVIIFRYGVDIKHYLSTGERINKHIIENEEFTSDPIRYDNGVFFLDSSVFSDVDGEEHPITNVFIISDYYTDVVKIDANGNDSTDIPPYMLIPVGGNNGIYPIESGMQFLITNSAVNATIKFV